MNSSKLRLLPWERQFRQFHAFVAVGEEFEGPGFGEEDDGAVVAVVGNGGAGGHVEVVVPFDAVGAADPADVAAGAAVEAELGVVLTLEAVLDVFELEGADTAPRGGGGRCCRG